VQAIGDVNRAKLYYLRAKVGKKARVREVQQGPTVSSRRAPDEAAEQPDEPVAEEPAVDEPVADELAADEPAADEQSGAEEPVAEDAVGDEPAAEEPVAVGEDSSEAAEVRPKARRSLRRRG
jgi:hypothetical protein